MKTLSEFIAPLLSRLGQKQVRENVISLTGKLIENQTGQLWSISEDKNEYSRNLSLLNGTLKTVVDVEKLNISLLANNTDYFRDKSYIIVLHDGSDIRKQHSKELENLDIVRDLSGKLVNGYPTFNSVAVDLKGKNIRLLQTTPYSSKESHYLSQTDIADYHAGRLLKKRKKEVAALLESENWYNHNTIVEQHALRINEKIKAVNPDAVIVHVYDRGHDNVELFEYQTDIDSLFVVRLKLNRNSNELTINNKGKEVAVKLVAQQFFNSSEKCYEKVRFKTKTYQQAKGIFEWTTIELNNRTYSVVKVRFYTRKGHKIFKEPMLLITNMEVDSEKLAELVFELYMKRSKIEGVFKFCKEKLGWENFRIRQFEGIKNLIGLVYFIAGYFHEVEKELINHPAAQWLAQLGNGKGKVTPHYILIGLGKVANFLMIRELFNQSKEDKTLAQQGLDIFFIGDFDFG